MRGLGWLVLVLGVIAFAVDVAFAEEGDDIAQVVERGPEVGGTLTRGNACMRPRSCDACCRRDQRCGWTASAGALFMRREDPDSEPLMTDAATDDVLLNAKDFEFGYEPGVELALTKHRLFGCVDLELRYFQIAEFSDRTSTSLAAPSLVRINTEVPFFIPGVDSITSEYSSELSGLELNARWRFPCLSGVRWLAGFRCIRLDEEFTSQLGATALPSVYETETENLLCGIQIGADVDIVSSKCFCLRVFVKGGIFRNEAEHDTVLDTSVVEVTADDDETKTAYVAEAGLTAVWCLSRSLPSAPTTG